MSIRKITVIAITLLILTIGAVFSAPGYYESRLYYLPKSVENNKNVAIDLSSDKKSLATSDYNNDGVNLISSPNNLAMFRIMENIMPPKSEYQSINDTVKGGITLTITSTSNWTLVHESNPTQTVAFSLDAFCVESKWTPSQYDFVASPVKKLTANSTLSASGKSSTITNDGTTYTIFMPYTGVSNKAGSGNNSGQGNVIRIPEYQRDYDVCLNITGDISGLQPGYYYTVLNYETTDYYESPAVVTGNSVSLPGNDTPSSVSGTITIWAYIGDVVNDTSGYNLSVSPSDDTYTMDLGITSQSTPYKVADIQFYFLEIVSSQPNQNTEENRFTIYISPTRDYTVAGTYQFVKMNTEGQNRNDRNTIYYDLYLGTNSGYKKFSEIGDNTLNQGVIGSAGVLSGVSTTYKILPEYTQTKTGSSTTINGHTVGALQYMKTWELSQTIYLMLTNTSLQNAHSSGMYYSYLYVTLVAN